MNLYCSRRVVQSTEVRLPNAAITNLVKANNPCAFSSRTLAASVKQYPRGEVVFEAFSAAIVAHCGSSDVILSLPMSQIVDLDRMKKKHPKIARLWELGSEISHLAFGPADTFHDRTDEDDLKLQQAGERFVPELVSGRYDSGLTAAVRGNVGNWRSPSFKSLLEDYRGPVSVQESQQNFVPLLMNADTFQFNHFVAPKYPPLAKQARIQSKVELRLTVDSESGEVLDAMVVSGHPLLRSSALDAAKQWRFKPKSVETKTLNVTLDFALH